MTLTRLLSHAAAATGLLWPAVSSSADFPQAGITNGPVRAVLYLPDAAKGYYQGTRFDWSGQIASLTYKGHSFFGKWFDRYDPKIHDAILGPVEEFLTGDAGLGYSDAKPGASFVRIGVGGVRKPEEPAYRRFHTYEITDPGVWTVKRFRDRVEFTHDLADVGGYGYRYTKVVRLAAGRPRLVLEHRLENRGRKPIETAVYDHNFYMLDDLPTGPDTIVRVPFPLKAVRDLQGKATAGGHEFRFERELSPGESVFTELEGFSSRAADYDLTVENRKAGIGVRQTADRPITKLILWSIRTTVCPEAYITMTIPPGKSHSWRITYDFYIKD